MNNKISNFCQKLEHQFSKISLERKLILLEIVDFIHQKHRNKEIARLTVICTHNSRRSHIAQLFLAIGAQFYGVKQIETYSGGTEATAMNPRVVKALQNIGIEISNDNATDDNPRYKLRWTLDMKPYEAFSKVYDEYPNPKENFAAIMVCNEADEACPVVTGSASRMSIPFQDPKEYDDSVKEAKAYQKSILGIATEMLFIIKKASIN